MADQVALRLMFRERTPSLRQKAVADTIKWVGRRIYSGRITLQHPLPPRRDFEWRQRATEDLREYADLLHMQVAMEEHDARAEQMGTNAQMVVRR